MLALPTLIAAGFSLGMAHATDADHVLAVSTIVSRERSLRGAAVIGALWGLGHGVAVAIVGCLIILFGVVIPPRVGLAMEFAVGIMLVLLGLFTLIEMAKQVRAARALRRLGDGARHADVPHHLHVHAHGDYAHSHGHGHAAGAHGHVEHATPLGWLDRHVGGFRPYQIVRPLVVGVVHGMAGSAAAALLVLSAVRDPVSGVAYLMVFGAGTIAGMMLITMAIAVPFTRGPSRLPQLRTGARVASGVLSLGFGLFLMNRIAVVDGLFSAASL